MSDLRDIFHEHCRLIFMGEDANNGYNGRDGHGMIQLITGVQKSRVLSRTDRTGEEIIIVIWVTEIRVTYHALVIVVIVFLLLLLRSLSGGRGRGSLSGNGSGDGERLGVRKVLLDLSRMN